MFFVSNFKDQAVMKEMVSLVKWKKVQRQDQSEHVTPLDNLSVYIYERGSVFKIPGVFSISFDGILKTQNYMENTKEREQHPPTS